MDDLYSLLRRLDDQSIVLDLGCGHGSFQYEACRGRIVAMDLTLPEKTALKSEAAYMRADSSTIPLPNESVDAVISHHTLEHFIDYKKTLSEVRRILRPNGWLWIAVPNGFGFDDALYRMLYAGGGHVNRFRYETLVQEVESATGTRLARSCDLFSSFIYIRPGSAGFLARLPKGFLTFSVLALNTVTRLVDKAFGSRYSQYGWGFAFVRGEMKVDEMPSYFNVCRECGAGDSAEFLRRYSSRTFFGLGIYDCPHCGRSNVLVSPPRNFQ